MRCTAIQRYGKLIILHQKPTHAGFKVHCGWEHLFMVINDSWRQARESFVFSTQSASFCCPRSRSNLGHFFDLSCLYNPLLLFPLSEGHLIVSPALLNSRMPCLTTVNNGHDSLLLCLAVDQRSSNKTTATGQIVACRFIHEYHHTASTKEAVQRVASSHRIQTVG